MNPSVEPDLTALHRQAPREWRPAHPTQAGAYALSYGADYNPDQWQRQVWQEDFALMSECGLNLATPAVFSWARLQSGPEEWDFTWLDEIMENLAARGIGVDLATATASPPAWLARLYPDSLPVDERGVRLEVGSRQQICPSSPDFQRAAQSLVRRLAERYGHHPALRLWHISNEYACHIRECYCERCQEEFRAFLAAKYGDIQALNSAWHTSFWSQLYQDFSQIRPPAKLPTFHNPAQVVDWRRFSDLQWRRLYLREALILKEVSPQVPITTNFMGDFAFLDYAKWAALVDVAADDHYPDPADPTAIAQVAYMSDLARSWGTEISAAREQARQAGEEPGVAGGGKYLPPRPQAFILMEQSPNNVQWRRRNAPKAPGLHRLWSVARWARGADALCHFQWRAAPGGAEAYHGAMVPHAGRNSRIWRDTCQLGQTLAELPAAGPGPWPLAQVAVVMDWESEWARQASIGMAGELSFGAARQWHRACFEAGLSVDMARPNWDLSAYRLIIVPQLFALAEDFAANLRRAVEGGAQVLVVGPSGWQDLQGRVNLGGYLGPLRQVLGVEVTDYWQLGAHTEDFYPGDGQVAGWGFTGTGSGVGAGTGSGVGAGADSGAFGQLSGGQLSGEDPYLDHFAQVNGADTPYFQAVFSPGGYHPATLRVSPQARDLLSQVPPASRLGGWAPSGPGSAAAHLETWRVTTWAEELRLLDPQLQVWATWEGYPGAREENSGLAGGAALTCLPYAGGGRAWYLGAQVDSAARAAVLSLMCAGGQIAPQVGQAPLGCEAVRRPDGTLVLLNYTAREQVIAGERVPALDFHLLPPAL